MSTPSKDKCIYCEGTGHWEKDCWCKQRRLSCKEAQAEHKGGNKKGKGKKGKEKEKKEEQTPVVSTVIAEIPDQPSGSTSAVPTMTFNTDAIRFYIQCGNMWMLDSRCTHHITSDKNNFTVYHPLPALQIVWFADQKAYTTYIGIGTVKGTTQVRGETK